MDNGLMNWLEAHGLYAHVILQLAFSAMLAVLFLQSSLDKLFNWNSEKAYLTQHFSKSILKGTVPFLLPVITLIELGAGICSALGALITLFGGGCTLGVLGALLGTKAIFMLFLGQRVAKDYPGAASLVPYFLLCIGAAGVHMMH